MSSTTPGTPARLQIGYSFAQREYRALTGANQRMVRSEVGRRVREWFPIEVRDEWLTLQIPADESGTYPTSEALILMDFKIKDPRITRSDIGIDPATVQLAYNIHDDVQCSSVRVDFVLAPTTRLQVAVPVQDPALTGGAGQIVADFDFELKWEVSLSQVVV